MRTALIKLLGLEPVSLVIKRSTLRWSDHVECKDDPDCIKQCMMMESEGNRQRVLGDGVT